MSIEEMFVVDKNGIRHKVDYTIKGKDGVVRYVVYTHNDREVIRDINNVTVILVDKDNSRGTSEGLQSKREEGKADEK